MTVHVCHTPYKVLGDTPVFSNTRQQLFLKPHPILTWYSEAAKARRKWGMLSCSPRTFQKLCKRAMLSHHLLSLQKPHKNSVCFHTVFRSNRGHGRAFSEAVSGMNGTCNWSSLRWATRGLSREREHHLKVSGMWQILGNVGPRGQLCSSPMLMWFEEWCETAFVGGGGARAEVQAWA